MNIFSSKNERLHVFASENWKLCDFQDPQIPQSLGSDVKDSSLKMRNGEEFGIIRGL